MLRALVFRSCYFAKFFSSIWLMIRVPIAIGLGSSTGICMRIRMPLDFPLQEVHQLVVNRAENQNKQAG
jgi:hypothetical protein